MNMNREEEDKVIFSIRIFEKAFSAVKERKELTLVKELQYVG
jgi:hypothetical protein